MIFTDEYWMRMALAEAEEARKEGEVPIGAVIVCNGKVLAKAHNRTEALTDVTAHAEMQAITSASDSIGGKYLPDCTIYVTVEPCPMCAAALAWAQIGRVVYGTPDAKRGSSRFGNMYHPRTQVDAGVMEDECREIIQDFFRSKR